MMSLFAFLLLPLSFSILDLALKMVLAWFLVNLFIIPAFLLASIVLFLVRVIGLWLVFSWLFQYCFEVLSVFFSYFFMVSFPPFMSSDVTFISFLYFFCFLFPTMFWLPLVNPGKCRGFSHPTMTNGRDSDNIFVCIRIQMVYPCPQHHID